jgi:hypothetical protein
MKRKMAKGTILGDTFEQLAELGQSTAKKTVKSVVQTFNPLSVIASPDKIGEKQSRQQAESLDGKNHTPLDFKKLQNNFQNKEKSQADALRNRLFQMVRQGDEKLLMEKRQKDLEKKRREEMEKQERTKKEEERLRNQGSGIIPKGKSRRSIFSHKKAAQQQQTEVKPASGKQ